MEEQKKLSKWVVMAVVIAVVAATGYLIYNQYGKSKGGQPENPAVAGWKTFANDQLGFEFKYPDGHNVQGMPIGKPSGLSLSLTHGTIFVYEINGDIMNVAMPQDCMFNSKELQDKNGLSYMSTKNINGVDFYYYINYKSMPEYLGAYCGMSSGCWYQDVYRTLHNGKCFEVSYKRADREFMTGDPNKNPTITGDVKAIPDTFMQILSTFKFTK